MYSLNPLGRFSDRAGDYASYRPGYPETAIQQILGPSPASLTVADIGAGTGISSRLLADRGARVIAIEPNHAMRQAAVLHPRINYRDRQAEATGLADKSVDRVVCAQAFHWFQPEISLQEFHRILKPGGQLFLLWNDRNLSDGFTHAYDQLIRHITGNNYPNHEHRRSLNTVADSPFFSSLEHYSYAYSQPLTFAALLGRCRSSSYIPQSGPDYERLISGLKQIFTQWKHSDNTVHFMYKTHLYQSQRQGLP